MSKAKSKPATPPAPEVNWTRRVLLLLAVVAALAAVGATVINRPKPVPIVPVAPAAPPPAPWFYDEANNQHWDPGHNHWHQGPPPAQDQR